MRVLWVLLLVGASVAMVTVDKNSSMEDFTDDKLVDISEREPEPVDEQGTEDENENEPGGDSADEDWDQSCREVEGTRRESVDKGDEEKYDDDDDSDDDDDDNGDGDDDNDKDYGLEKRHHHRHRPHHHHRHHHHRHHRKHHRHGKHGRRGICRRQFCGCKRRAGKNCRQVIGCFMSLALCVRRRKCHMRPHHGLPRKWGRVESEWMDAFQSTGEPDPPRRPHRRRQCVKHFRECNVTAKEDCKAKIKCVIKLKHCLRSGNWSHPTTPPHPTPQESEGLDDFQDEELMEVPNEDSLLDEERHGNRTGHRVCDGDGLGKNGDFRRPGAFGGFKRPVRFGGFKRPGGFGGFKRPGAFGGFKRPGGFGGFKRPEGFGGFKRPGGFGGITRPGFKRHLGVNTGYKRYRLLAQFTEAGKFAGVKKPTRRPHPSGRPTPSKKCKQILDDCLKKAGVKDNNKKFKCYFTFLHCVRHEWRPTRGPVQTEQTD